MSTEEKPIIFDIVKSDTITFATELLPECWSKLQEFVSSLPQHKDFELKSMYVNKETRIQQIDFFCTRPEEFLNLLVLWWCKEFDNTINTAITLYTRSSCVITTANARSRIAECNEALRNVIAEIKQHQAEGKTLEESLAIQDARAKYEEEELDKFAGSIQEIKNNAN